LTTSRYSMVLSRSKGKAASSRSTPYFGLRWLDNAFTFEEPRIIDHAAAFNGPQSFERESCVEPQHSTTASHTEFQVDAGSRVR
jgi:hypothetical protein